ncbi:proton-coupled zinc antiporter SLC30A2 isoform X2 [Pteronotus mesoamericanus]|uniref:proton-coupled zinc antiporter SLC30A2 isoform X2 n=1 Tax=Pteronotus mesoamericanus TaxID=1884717 RepID=UPI0023EE1B88|nr:proton-coupled zinc antiporter SLC30A2 isoform X2 [Pteronotus parnellii mesoamericanus]
MKATDKQHLLDAKPGARSYMGSLWQDGASWISVSPPDSELPSIELAVESNHYCHAQKGPGRRCDPKKERATRQLYVASAICLVFMIGEIIEILGALLSVLSIWVMTGVLVYLAVERLISGNYEIEGKTMLITAGCAVAVNILMGLTLHQSGYGHSHDHGHSHDPSQQQESPSVRAAFIHVIGDLLQSLGILVAAYILYFKPEYKYVDPICTFLFSVLVLGTTLTILRDVILVLMEGTPKGVDFTAVRDLLLSVEGVEALHSLHIWALTVAQPVLSVHIAVAQNTDAQAVLKAASACLQGKFYFHTITIQIEDYSEDMKDCQACQGPSD